MHACIVSSFNASVKGIVKKICEDNLFYLWFSVHNQCVCLSASVCVSVCARAHMHVSM